VHPDEPDDEPEDLVEKEVWDEITWLTDDVSLRTSDTYGTELKAMNELWGAAIEMSEKQGDPWFHVVLDVADNLQAALFNAMCGYYKVAGWCLRTAVENAVAGTYLQLYFTEADAAKWQNGDVELSFSVACDKLPGHPVVESIESYLQESHGYTLFQQRTPSRPPGWIRSIFKELSEFSHARPAYSDAKMWDGSNGPVFAPSSFRRIYLLYLNTAFVVFLLARLGRPQLEMPPSSKWFFHSKRIKAPEFMKGCFRMAFGALP
jgi:hypothetical protein